MSSALPHSGVIAPADASIPPSGEDAPPAPPPGPRRIGAVLAGTTLAVLLDAWTGLAPFALLGALGTVGYLAVALARVKLSRRLFVAFAAVLAAIALATRPDGAALVADGLGKASFILALFVALTALREPAARSPSIGRTGRDLAAQPPGRRYIALSTGGHLFALVLNYGAITLLGGLARDSLGNETDPQVRAARSRRMLLAVQRGFCASLCWSPFAFSMAVGLAVVPGATWGQAALPAVGSAAILTLVGWSLDALFRPAVAGPRRRREPTGSPADVLPLLGLLALLGSGVAAVEFATDVPLPAIVMALVPLAALGWMLIQETGAGPSPAARVAARIAGFARSQLPSYDTEIVLVASAGFIGSVGGALLAPHVAGSAVGAAVAGLPPVVVLVAMVWLIPLAGQAGMNPILAVSLVAPLLPPPQALGVPPAAVVLAITAGWSLSGATSPFTATTMLVGRLGGLSALAVGLRWNGVFAVVAGLALSLYVALLAGAL